MILESIIIIGFAILLDLILGDPKNRYHPTAWIGNLIGIITTRVKNENQNLEKFGGIFIILIPISVSTAILLIFALISIRQKNIILHENLMKSAIALSVVFLGMYVAYHMTSDPTPYGGDGFSYYIYFFILITHIILSIGIIPMVLITYVRAISKLFKDHKKIARITFPIWLYIAVTGVIIYLMISPYYAN